jgi:Flp pilus assembly protein TadB
MWENKRRDLVNKKEREREKKKEKKKKGKERREKRKKKGKKGKEGRKERTGKQNKLKVTLFVELDTFWCILSLLCLKQSQLVIFVTNQIHINAKSE